MGVATATLPAGPAAAAVGDAHLLVTDTDNTPGNPYRLLHRLRLADQTWLPRTQWGDAYSAIGAANVPASDLAAAVVGGQMHLVYMNNISEYYHALRRADGTWTKATGLDGFAGTLIGPRSVAAANVRGNLHVVSRASDGLHHTERNSGTGFWTPFTKPPPAGWSNLVVDVAAAGTSNGLLHVLGLDTNGRVWHGVRNPDTGLWTSPGSPGQAANAWRVAAAAVGDLLHVAVLTAAAVYHQVRYPDGSWSSLNLLQDITGGSDIGAAATPNGEFQLTMVGDGQVRHRVRRADSSWTAFVTLDRLPVTRTTMAA